MTLPQNVKDALSRVHMMVDSESEWADIDIADWQTIRAHLLSQEAELADYKNASLHAADDCVAKDAEIARLQSRLAAANALLLNFSKAVADTAFKMRAPNQWTPVFVQMAQEAERQSHLQGAGDEATN